jgi:hypothetical protein
MIPNDSEEKSKRVNALKQVRSLAGSIVDRAMEKVEILRKALLFIFYLLNAD